MDDLRIEYVGKCHSQHLLHTLQEHYIMAEEMITLRQTLYEMGWPQPPTPLQTYNYTGEGVVNNTIFQRNIKSMDL